jgi:DNA-binding IscR family transcriptional regulator
MVVLCRRFRAGKTALSADELGAELLIPPRLLMEILELLLRLGLIVAVAGDDGSNAYLPARESDTVTIMALLAKIAGDGTDYLPPDVDPEHAVIVDMVGRLARSADESLAGVTLRDMVEQAEKKGEEGFQPSMGQ